LSVARVSKRIFNKYKYLRYSLASLLWAAQNVVAALPDTVKFLSRDGKSELTGYLFKPETAGPHPAVVMLHGRGGPYSTLRPGVADAGNLSARHRLWGEFWAARGFVALHVDSFGPRGYAQGFAKHSYASRPAAVNEQTVRPLDAYGALDYLRTRADVAKDRIGLHGWSNGAMTLLAAMGMNAPRLAPDKAAQVRLAAPTPRSDFRAAIAQYPGCRVQRDQGDYVPYAPLLLLTASDDDEVSPHVCETLAQQVKGRGAAIEFLMYPGAHHGYDDPGKSKQSHAPNKAALDDTLKRAALFFRQHLVE
jgi:dienelactone hydrolase